MPSYSKQTQDYHISRIRAVLVIRPNASSYEIQEALERSAEAPLRLDRHYIDKLKKKIIAERARRNDRLTIHSRIAELQDKHGLIAGRLWVLATASRKDEDRIRALKQLFENDVALLQAEMDAGIYERHLGTGEIKVFEERRIQILQAFANFNLLKPNGDPNTNSGEATGAAKIQGDAATASN